MWQYEHITRAPLRALEGAGVSEEPWNLNLISFTVNLPLDALIGRW